MPATRSKFMRCRTTLLASALLAGLFGCASDSIEEVQTSFGPYVPFQGFGSSFDFSRAPRPPARDPRLENPQLHEIIRVSVENQLTSKGYRRANQGAPDFWVLYSLGTRYRVERTGPDTSAYSEGLLVVEIVDSKRGQRMWQASAVAVVDPSDSPDKRRERIENTAKRMFEAFPAKANP